MEEVPSFVIFYLWGVSFCTDGILRRSRGPVFASAPVGEVPQGEPLV